jgi:dihydrofolate reductase
MGNVNVDISMSLDGFVAGPNRTLDTPLGEGGELLHEWIVATKSWREVHGKSGGEDTPDDEIARESIEAAGATVMGRRMYSGGEGAWEDDPNADGWWGDDPPFHHPVFVLTQHAREPVTMKGGTTFTFVTDGIESALEQAKASAGDKNVTIAGGANTIQQYLRARLVDEVHLHLVPALLGDGVRLFEGLGNGAVELTTTRVVESPAVTHVMLRASG